VVASEKRGLIAWNASTVDVMFSCADCGVCKSHCVTDQPLPDAIAAVRARLVDQDLGLPSLADLKSRFEKWENLYAETSPEAATGTGDVALFVGDAAAHRSPETRDAALALLKAIGIEPVLIGVGRNNGYLASSLGFAGLARRLAEKTLAELKASGASRLLVLSPGDAYAFTTLYEDRLELPWPEGIDVQEVVSVLAEAHAGGNLALNRSEVGLPLAYVDPTHTVRALGRSDAPRQLLEAVLPTAPLELFWRRERAHPCGDGALEFTKPDIAEKLTRARLEDARDRGAQGVITDDPGSLYQLNRFSSSDLPAKGLYELLADHLK
jgi:Fe-S oxidoreductase